MEEEKVNYKFNYRDVYEKTMQWGTNKSGKKKFYKLNQYLEPALYTNMRIAYAGVFLATFIGLAFYYRYLQV